MMKLRSTWWLLLCVLQITLTADAQQRQSASHLKPALSNRELAARVRTSLVLVVTQDRSGNAVAEGSGFFLKPGLVVTNLHVLKRSSRGYIKVFSDGKKYEIASIVGFDINHDICVLKLPVEIGTPLTLSADKVEAGDDILVAGNPEGLEASFSKGIVSGVRSDSGLLQMDAAISPGSSGGPVVNNRGEVVGISVSTLVSGQNLNFAVPVRYLRELQLDWNLDVRQAGALAVTDAEERGFHGPVKSFIEEKATYEIDPVSKTTRLGPYLPVAASRFSPDGKELEFTSFNQGKESGKVKYEYSADGLLKRIVTPTTSYEFSRDNAVGTHVSNIHFDQMVSSGREGEKDYHEDGYDSAGRLIVQSFPGDGLTYIPKYDVLGNEVESRGYKNGGYVNGQLWSIVRYVYKVNDRRDWVTQVESARLATDPEDDFSAISVSLREITYYNDQQ
ncbi:MAG TPA: serine protease [Candidatus Sulfotelmatobacter sp.]|nr:serine protease [Candidatus Sulfotelmatobacter sp.]